MNNSMTRTRALMIISAALASGPASTAALAAADYQPVTATLSGKTITLSGRDLTIDEVVEVARFGARFS